MKKQGGFVLILVLVLLLVGCIMLIPLSKLVATGLKAGTVYENKAKGFYAADAGQEDAKWKIANFQILKPYNITVNGYKTDVIITDLTDDFLFKLMGDDKDRPHEDWLIVSKEVNEGQCTISYHFIGKGNKKLSAICLWIDGEYTVLSNSGLTNKLPVTEDVLMGHKFTWLFNNVPLGDTGSLVINLSPSDKIPLVIPWMETLSNDIGMSYSITSGAYEIKSSNSNCTIISNVIMDEGVVGVETFNIKGAE
jgi:hypothetical protein